MDAELHDQKGAAGMMLQKGGTLTIDKEIISVHGSILFEAGQKVTIRQVINRAGFWGAISNIYHEGEIIGVKLEERSGDWPLKMFKEP